MKSSFLCIILLIGTVSFAQVSEGGRPMSLDPRYQALFSNALPEIQMPAFDLRKIRKEDESSPGTRFAAPISTNIALREMEAGWTELENGDRVWRLQIRSQGALAVAFFYENFYLPQGARLFMYSPDGTQVAGAYTFRNTTTSGRFWTGLIYGETAIVEYYEPAAVKGQGHFRISRVDHAYDAVRLASGARMSGFGTSLPCHANLNCPAGNNWQDEARGVCRIIVVVEEGMGFCTGNVMNNTAKDGKPFLLTAFHCMDGYTPIYHLWRFDFQYQSAGCSNPVTEPTFRSLLGGSLRASRQQNDFLLLELSSAIPASYNVWLNGWNKASNVTPLNSTIMHHPVGDIKKIATATTPAAIHTFPIDWSNDVITPANHHFRVNYSTGTFEPGSSGAGLFNQQQLIVGQLHGGDFACTGTTTGYFGRLAFSWNGGDTASSRLKDWLDPSGAMVGDTIHGMENPATGSASAITGFVGTEQNLAIAGVIVTLTTPDTTLTDTTGIDGFYHFAELQAGGTYSLALRKNSGLLTNGVTTSDIIRIRKSILAIESLAGPYKIFAADVNASGELSTTDIIHLSRAILALSNSFPGVESWQFFPADFVFGNAQSPLAETVPMPYVVENLSAEDITDISFIGIKSGDVNDSADTQN
ncbi:MAG: hypothetical protein ACKV1O_26885 [Saprospiraceae bacterium]